MTNLSSLIGQLENVSFVLQIRLENVSYASKPHFQH